MTNQRCSRTLRTILVLGLFFRRMPGEARSAEESAET
jgi:hypothetical protein